MLFPLLNLILAIFLSPELGFFGFVTPTLTQTPFISGRSFSAGEVVFVSRVGGRTWFLNRRCWLSVTCEEGVDEKERMVGVKGRHIECLKREVAQERDDGEIQRALREGQRDAIIQKACGWGELVAGKWA